jgi:hypothetical protein
MTTATLKELFDAVTDDYLDFARIENPPSQRPDLCAFILLDRLLPGGDSDIVSASEHDEFYLSFDCDELAKVATPELVRDLSRCGVRYDESFNALCMFS